MTPRIAAVPRVVVLTLATLIAAVLAWRALVLGIDVMRTDAWWREQKDVPTPGSTDALWRQRPALAIQLLEKCRLVEEAWRQGLRRQCGRFDARRQWQDGQRLADLFKMHVPAGQRVLRRGQPAHEGGDGAGGSRRKNRGHGADGAALQIRAGWVPCQRALSEAVDDQQNDVARLVERSGGQGVELGVARSAAAAGRGDALHQVDEAFASVVGEHDRRHDENDCTSTEKGACAPFWIQPAN